MRASIVLAVLLLLTATVSAQSLQVGLFELTLAKGFQVLPVAEGEVVRIRTPAWHPVSVVPLELGHSENWESAALDFLLTEYRRVDPRIGEADRPEEISIKREGAWTTLYWTYGGTRAYFGMFWGGSEAGSLLFWASPLAAPGRPQYQALSEVTKGVTIRPL